MTYDAWKTDPDFGLSNREMLEREARQQAAEDKAERADALIRQARALMAQVLPLARELEELEAHGPRYGERMTYGPGGALRRVPSYACPAELVCIAEEWAEGDPDVRAVNEEAFREDW